MFSIFKFKELAAEVERLGCAERCLRGSHDWILHTCGQRRKAGKICQDCMKFVELKEVDDD